MNLYAFIYLLSPEGANLPNRVWLRTCTCTLYTCASESDVTCSLFYFVLFIDNFLFESLNILQQQPGGEDKKK